MWFINKTFKLASSTFSSLVIFHDNFSKDAYKHTSLMTPFQ